MKLLPTCLVLVLLCCMTSTFAQKQYTVDGNTYTLNMEVTGPISLLWNTIDDEYRYFVKKGSTLIELKNSKVNGNYQEEYKTTLNEQTGGTITADKVKFTRPSLAGFIDSYNRNADPNYQSAVEKISISTRLGGFAGINNNIYFINPENASLPVFGIDFEIIDMAKLKRHAILFQFAQTLSSSDYKFSSSELSLSYRYKILMQEKFDIFLGVKGASYINISRDLVATGSNGQEEVVKSSGGDIRSPGSFGVGADIALGSGYLSVAYNDIFSLGLENNSEFPVYLTVGYKLPL